jgi:hypothetical protein
LAHLKYLRYSVIFRKPFNEKIGYEEAKAIAFNQIELKKELFCHIAGIAPDDEKRINQISRYNCFVSSYYCWIFDFNVASVIIDKKNGISYFITGCSLPFNNKLLLNIYHKYRDDMFSFYEEFWDAYHCSFLPVGWSYKIENNDILYYNENNAVVKKQSLNPDNYKSGRPNFLIRILIKLFMVLCPNFKEQIKLLKINL